LLELVDIRKKYGTGTEAVEALKGINIQFPDSGFVAILGQSGCGKTTLLNIIGGLDQYTSGDLIINGVSTKKYKNADWDAYRNHSVGFVFQSYQLINHQTVLANVELTMTLSGLSKKERRKRAIEALTKVGLGNKIKKKPNQMSGGQMQRAAIARALVNNPDIILADEPTGALDSKTSVQIMELLKEVSKDHLVVMVTHNPELANRYATRIIRLFDGQVESDREINQVLAIPEKNGHPVVEIVGKKPEKKTSLNLDAKKKNKNLKSMSFWTAFSLSLNNLMTKKGRTFLTSFAGAIGIIGIALVLATSTGVQMYIDNVESDTLSQYPLTIQRETVDFTQMFQSMRDKTEDQEEITEDTVISEVVSSNMMTNIITSLVQEKTENDMEAFKEFLDNNEELQQYVQAVEYQYATTLNVYNMNDVNGNIIKANPSTVLDKMGMMGSSSQTMMSMMNSTYDVFMELPKSTALTETLYEVVDGRLPESYDEVVLALNANGKIGDYTLYSIGLLDQENLTKLVNDVMAGQELDELEVQKYSFDELENLSFRVLVNSDYYELQKDGTYLDCSEDEDYLADVLEKQGIELKVVGIVRTKQSSSSDAGLYGGVLYTPELMEELIERVNDSEIVKKQLEDKTVDVFTGISFVQDKEKKYTMEELQAYLKTLPEETQAQTVGMIQGMKAQGMSDDEIVEQFSKYLKKETKATYSGNLSLLGVSSIENPAQVLIYPKDFETKEDIIRILDEYSASLGEDKELKYTDYVGLIMSSVTTIINVITYVLIGFVAVSLVVSSIMIGIITYISVLERTREIGILRSIGASKKDISRVFNAETLIIGFVSGLIGVGIPYAISIFVNNLIETLYDVKDIMHLSWEAAVILVIISMFLTYIGGLIPSRIAAKKDPVEALRTE